MGEWRYWAALDATRIMDVTEEWGLHIHERDLFFLNFKFFLKDCLTLTLDRFVTGIC